MVEPVDTRHKTSKATAATVRVSENDERRCFF